MAAPPRPRLTPEQYLEIERAAETRHEYFDGQMYAMAGGSYPHSRIIANLARRLGNALDGRPCVVTVQDVRTSVAHDGLYTYPDVVVVCGQPAFLESEVDTAANPTLILEVLSPTTEAYDRGFKFAQYRRIEPLQEYGLVSQNEARVELFRRKPNGQWVYSDFAGLDATCVFDSIECRIALTDIYDNVTLEGRTLPRPPGAVE